MAADSTSAGPAAIAELADGRLVIAATAAGSFAIPSTSAHGSSSSTTVASTWGFVLGGDQLTTIGELARGTSTWHGWFARGRGSAVFATSDGTLAACAAGARRALPALPGTRRLLGLAVDGELVTAVSAEPLASAGCTGLIASAMRSQRLHVDVLDISAPAPAWTSRTTRDVDATAGNGCRALAIYRAAATRDGAAIVTETCTAVDAGDSISTNACALRVEAWVDGAWTSSAVPIAIAYGDARPLVDVRDRVVRLAIGTGGDHATTTVYRVDGDRMVAEGGAITGAPIALDGAGLVTAKLGGARRGDSGIGFQLQAYALVGGAWTSTTGLLDVDAVEGAAFAWQADRIVGVLPEDQFDRNPITARIVEARGGQWRELPAARVALTP